MPTCTAVRFGESLISLIGLIVVSSVRYGVLKRILDTVDNSRFKLDSEFVIWAREIEQVSLKVWILKGVCLKNIVGYILVLI